MKTLTKLVASILLLGATSTTTFCAISASTSVTQPSCSNANDGSVSVTPSGGTPQYTYLWTTGHTTQSVQNIGAGTYYVTVTDALNNTVVEEVTLLAPAPLSVSGTITNVNYNGGANGAIDITINGGTPEYSHYWTSSNGSGQIMGALDQTNLTAGTYNFTIIDANECSTIATFVVGTSPIYMPALVDAGDLTISGPVSIATTNAAQVYPNPSFGGVNIKSMGETQRVEIYNSNGTLVQQIDQLANTEEIHSLDLKPGNYTVNFLQKDGSRSTERLIVR